jgi:hypothetical protein
MTRRITASERAALLLAAGALSTWFCLSREFHAAGLMTAVAHVAALGMWAVHLRRAGLGAAWVFPAAAGLAILLTQSPSGRLDAPGLGEAIFLYALLSLFSAYERQPGLQAIATAALLMSAGILTKPPVAICCVLVGLTFFLLHRRRTQSGMLGFALLMFTPMMLCVASAGVLAFLTGGPLVAAAAAASSPAPALERGAAGPVWLVFPAVVLGWRYVTRRTTASDIAFGLLLTGGAALSCFPRMPQPLRPIDLFYLSVGGAAALVVQTVTQRGQAQTPEFARLGRTPGSRSSRAGE